MPPKSPMHAKCVPVAAKRKKINNWLIGDTLLFLEHVTNDYLTYLVVYLLTNHRETLFVLLLNLKLLLPVSLIFGIFGKILNHQSYGNNHLDYISALVFHIVLNLFHQIHRRHLNIKYC